MIDLSTPQGRDTLAEKIQDDINAYCAEKYHSGHRDHLGASLMGEECSRKLWYNFRWVKEEFNEGRIERLFQVGHMAEPRLISYLRGIGFEVWEKDPQSNNQFRISGCNGHYGGSLDGKCKAPARYEISEDLIFLNEFKTNGTGTGFTNVEKLDLAKAKPKHFAQLSQYGFKLKLKYAIYIIENKNDSDLIVKIVQVDWQLGQSLENKASDIINSQLPPSRIAENASYYECKYCNFLEICFNGAEVEKNCRSCKFGKPVENSEWFCNRHNGIIPKDFIKVGCEDHASINI